MKKIEYKVGQRFEAKAHGQITYIKIMAISDGYVMLRYKGMIPFVKSVKELPSYLNNVSPQAA